MPFISVLMPVRNGMPFLIEAVESFLAQDHIEKELIIVDGLSSDGGEAFLEGLDDASITVLRGPDRSATEALNRAATLAKGDVIGLLMSDDQLAPGALTAIAQALDQSPEADLAVGAVEVCTIDIQTRFQVPAGRAPLDLGRLLSAPYAAAFFVRAGLWRRLQGFQETYRFGADRDFLMRAKLAGARARAIDQPVYRYRQHQGSDTMGGKVDAIIAFLDDHLRMTTAWLDDEAAGPLRDQLICWSLHEAASLAWLRFRRRKRWSAAKVVLEQMRLYPRFIPTFVGELLQPLRLHLARRFRRRSRAC